VSEDVNRKLPASNTAVQH